MEPVITAAGWVVAVSGASAAMWKAVRAVWRLARKIEDTFDLVHNELKPNGGSSIKDTLGFIDLRLQTLERDKELDIAQRKVRQAETDAWRQWVMYQLGTKQSPFKPPPVFDPPEGEPV